MSTTALKTLFYPFGSGILPLPEEGSRVLFLGARAGLQLPQGFAGEIYAVQGFRPDFLALEALGYRVSPFVEGEDYDLALVLCSRHRGENELRVAEALERTVDGATVLVAGAGNDGVASLAKRIARLAPLDGQAPKYHGLAFWLGAGLDRPATAAALCAQNPPILVAGRFQTAPGMFSHDRIDPGSKLLAESLPDDLSGRIADFCAGWGYLSAQLLAHCPNVSSVDLYEAEYLSLEAARRNLAVVKSDTRFFWKDLLSEAIEGRYDAIVMNPPFHQGRATEPEIGRKLIAAAAKALAHRGALYMVANKNLPYEKALATAFSDYRQIAGDNAFKVFAARR